MIQINSDIGNMFSNSDIKLQKLNRHKVKAEYAVLKFINSEYSLLVFTQETFSQKRTRTRANIRDQLLDTDEVVHKVSFFKWYRQIMNTFLEQGSVT